MVSRYRHRRTSNPATAFPNPIEPGELVTNTANRQIAVGDANSGALGAPLLLLAVRVFDVRAQYASGDLVVQGGALYRAKSTITPGAFNAGQWDVYSTDVSIKAYIDAADALKAPLASPTFTGDPRAPTPSAGDNDTSIATTSFVSDAVAPKADKTYVDSADALKADKTYVDAADALKADKTYVDAADVLKADKTYVDAGDAAKVAKTGDTMTGPLQLPADPTAVLQAATKQYVDSHAPAAATTAEYIANSAPTKMLTPGAVWAAAANNIAITDGATLNIDLNLGSDFNVSLAAGGRTMANPTNGKVGQKGVIFIIQTSGGQTITTWGSAWKFAGGQKPVLSTAANAIDIVSYVVGAGGNMWCTFSAGFA